MVLAFVGGCGTRARPIQTSLDQWLMHYPLLIAHRGGDADWPEGSMFAYAHAAEWNASLAIEVPMWRTSDGVWVVSHDATTSRVFGVDHRIEVTPWHVLASLRSLKGNEPMARAEDVLARFDSGNRILFVDDKSGRHVPSFLGLLNGHSGRTRYVVKCYWSQWAVADAAHRRGYRTWGYYYTKDMSNFGTTQRHFDLLGLSYQAPVADFAQMHATGKRVIAHVIRTRPQASQALAKGADGLMVSGVVDNVPRGPSRASP